jgi:hypothetical protein
MVLGPVCHLFVQVVLAEEGAAGGVERVDVTGGDVSLGESASADGGGGGGGGGLT